jgi:hypothetical protein
MNIANQTIDSDNSKDNTNTNTNTNTKRKKFKRSTVIYNFFEFIIKNIYLINDYLDEELTWNTGFKYLRPKDFLTKPGYQLISNENNDNLKAGDFGGFCLGWCIWYIEHRLKNSKVNSKVLNEKTIEKMLRLDDSFLEYIRNYSNKLFNVKLNILKNVCPDGKCIKEKNISNINYTREDENKIIDYAKDYF